MEGCQVHRIKSSETRSEIQLIFFLDRLECHDTRKALPNINGAQTNKKHYLVAFQRGRAYNIALNVR